MTIRALDLVLGEPWAITPEGMNQVLAIAQRANESPEAVSARLGRPLDNTRSVTIRDGVAVISVTGPIFRRANLFTELSGATSVEVLATDIQTALDDGKVEALVLEGDSPGGQAAGISELAQLIHAADKPIWFHSDGQAASAMYWLAAAAGRLTLSASAMLGSIGVVLSYRAAKDAPIEVVSSQSPAKRATPETEAGRAELQRLVDDLAAVFVADVARFRGVSEERVLSDFGRGGMLVGAKAVAAGMADEVTTLERILAGRKLNYSSRSVFTMGAEPRNGGSTMHPIPEAVCTALGIPADASGDTAVRAIEGLKLSASKAIQEKGAEAHAAGITAERERVFGILNHAEAQDRLSVAVKIAETAAMTPDSAAALLASLPKEQAAAPVQDPLNAHMQRLGNPPVHGAEDNGDDGGLDASSLWDRALKRVVQ